MVSAQGQGQPSAVERQWAAVAKQREALKTMQDSIARQKESVRRQGGSATTVAPDFFIFDPVLASAAPGPSFDCEPLSEIRLGSLVDKSSKAVGLSPDLLRAVMRQESAGYPCAVSSAGAQGLMQLLPSTASDLGVDDPFDPQQNITGGAKLLQQLMNRYSGDVMKALGAYNAGQESVDRAGGLPRFPETVTYVDTIMRNLKIKAKD